MVAISKSELTSIAMSELGGDLRVGTCLGGDVQVPSSKVVSSDSELEVGSLEPRRWITRRPKKLPNEKKNLAFYTKLSFCKRKIGKMT